MRLLLNPSPIEAFVTPPPPPAGVANFTISPRAGYVPLSVTFINTSTVTYTEEHWHSGESNDEIYLDSSHRYVYETEGSFTAQLRLVVNGSNVYVNKQYVVVVPAGEAAPDFIASIESGAAPLTVDFTNLSLNATLSSWYFSDDESSTGWVDSSSPDWNPTHVFNTAGTFEVYLSVTNDTGASHLQVLIITVN